MFSFIKFYLLECFDYYIVAKGRKSFLSLLPDITTIAHSEVFEGTIWNRENVNNAGRPSGNSSLYWQPSKFINVKESRIYLFLLKDHCLLSGHVSSFEDFTVLNYESHKFKRLIKETLLVTKDKPLLNKMLNHWN